MLKRAQLRAGVLTARERWECAHVRTHAATAGRRRLRSAAQILRDDFFWIEGGCGTFKVECVVCLAIRTVMLCQCGQEFAPVRYNWGELIPGEP